MSTSDSELDAVTSESVAAPVYAPAPPSTQYYQAPKSPSPPVSYPSQENKLVYPAIRQQVPVYRQPMSQSQSYIDVQPEFTQSWADYYHPPGYLPLAFKNIYIPIMPQQQSYGKNNQYNGQQQQLSPYNPNSIGFGYVTWSGPINPASFYQPINPAYYYRHPPMAPFYTPAQPIAGYKQAIYQQAPQTYKGN